MPHSRSVFYPPWIEAIRQDDHCLGTVLQEAALMRDGCIAVGIIQSSKSAKKAFDSAETTMNMIRDGRIRPGTEDAWKKASDALRKFTQAYDTVPSVRRRPRSRRR